MNKQVQNYVYYICFRQQNYFYFIKSKSALNKYISALKYPTFEKQSLTSDLEKFVQQTFALGKTDIG